MKDLSQLFSEIAALNHKSQRRDDVNKRIIFSKILLAFGETLTKVGRLMHKSHSTIIYYVEQYDILMEYDEEFKSQFRELMYKVGIAMNE